MTKKLNLTKEVELTLSKDFHDNQAKLSNNFKNFKPHQWFSFVTFIIALVSFACTIGGFVFTALDHEDLWTVVDKFTNLSNWLVFAYCTIYTFFPNKKYFREDIFLIATITYIGFTFFGYNIILVAIGRYDEAYRGTFFDIFSDVWKHIVTPISFLAFGFYSMHERPWCIPKKKTKVLFVCMIVPTIYLIYLSTAPFWIQEPVRVYDSATGHKVISIVDGKIQYETYSVYSWPTNTKDYPISWLFIAITYFILLPVFILGSYSVWYIMWKYTYINKLIEKDKENATRNIKK